ncbi:MAG: exosortase/archaeosortase family protein [Planctomycetota bacterium]
MTSTPMTNLAGPPRPQPLITPRTWFWIGVCAALFIWMHWLFLYSTYLFSKDPDWSHVIIVPLISIYYIVQHKERLAQAPKRLCWWALPLVFFGLYAYIWGVYPGRNDMLRGYSMVITVFATVLFLLGPAAMRVLWFPVAYLVFAVKVSDAIWSRVAEKLQDIAAAGATFMLQIFAEFMDFDIQATGNTIVMSFMKEGRWIDYPMNVAEACAGLRMLMAFIALGVALAFLFDRAWWQRLIMISLTVPIALAVNIGRVTALGLIATVNTEYAVGDFHLFVGMLMLIPAAGLFLLVGWILDKIVIQEEPEGNDSRSDLKAPAPPAPIGLRRILLGLALGAGLSLCSAVTYAMLFNSVAGKSLVDSLTPTVSAVLFVVGLLALGLLFWVARRASLGGTKKRVTASPIYGAALIAGVLAVAAAGQHSVLSWQKIVLHKDEVPLRHLFTAIPLDKGPYNFIKDDTLAPEIVDELGTEYYLSRWYTDSRLPKNSPGSQIRLHVAYYTGLVDTVPHVPDRCFVVSGVEHKGLHTEFVRLDPEHVTPRDQGTGFQADAELRPPGSDPFGPGTTVTLPSRDIETVRFTYGPNARTDIDQHVLYFFAANGKFLASPNDVRLHGFDIRDRHSYYCKIEVQVLGETDPDRVTELVTDLLDVMLPEILACLPDWEQVKAGEWPENTDLDQP